jgi:hypothetical protein
MIRSTWTRGLAYLWGILNRGFLTGSDVHGSTGSKSGFPYTRDIYFCLGGYKPTNESIALTITGTDVKASVMIPNKLILRLDRAAALGSDCSKTAVAMAEEEPPSVIPLVT